MYQRLVVFFVVLLLSACSNPSATPSSPQLISEITIAPGTRGAQAPTITQTQPPTIPPTLTPTNTPSVTVTSITDTPIPSLTARATHTETPSETPITPTITLTFSRTPRPSRTPTSTTTPPTTTPQNCPTKWFVTPQPPGCPLGPYVIGDAVFQPFENGFMIWFGTQKTIFVIYQSRQAPRWQQFPDTFQPGMPDNDPALVAPEGRVQPQRGFGLVWRSRTRVQRRIGWATGPESAYQGILQIDTLGNRFISGPGGEVYEFKGDLTNWQIFKPSGPN